MRETLASTAHLANQVARLGWYYAISRVIDRRARDLGHNPTTYRPTRPVPTQRELFADLGALLVEDAATSVPAAIRHARGRRYGRYEFIARTRAMLADLPDALARRASEDASSARATPAAADPGIARLFHQDFHFQTGGYLSEDSARLYDVQVETLFMGTAGPMRRAALAPLPTLISGRDQRKCLAARCRLRHRPFPAPGPACVPGTVTDRP